MCDNRANARSSTLCKVVGAERVGNDYHRLRLAPSTPFAAAPGQFVMVRVREGSQPLLRRPFSIHRFHPATGEFELLFRVVGAGTGILAKLSPGRTLDLLAPLGKGFGETGTTPLLVGGGIGVAPLLFFAEQLINRDKTPKLLLGGRSDRDLLCHDDFTCLNVPTRLATEDGSAGTPGLVTALLADEFENLGDAGRASASVHACGPIPMLAAVARLAAGYGVRCEVSLEAHMACGVGACLGCIVKGSSGRNLRVCREGPVFEAGEVEWQ